MGAWEQHAAEHGEGGGSGSRHLLNPARAGRALCHHHFRADQDAGDKPRCESCQRIIEARAAKAARRFTAQEIGALSPGDRYATTAGVTHRLDTLEEPSRGWLVLVARCEAEHEGGRLRRPTDRLCSRCFPPPLGNPPEIDGRPAHAGEVIEVPTDKIRGLPAIQLPGRVEVVFGAVIPGGWAGRAAGRMVQILEDGA